MMINIPVYKSLCIFLVIFLRLSAEGEGKYVLKATFAKLMFMIFLFSGSWLFNTPVLLFHTISNHFVNPN